MEGNNTEARSKSKISLSKRKRGLERNVLRKKDSSDLKVNVPGLYKILISGPDTGYPDPGYPDFSIDYT